MCRINKGREESFILKLDWKGVTLALGKVQTRSYAVLLCNSKGFSLFPFVYRLGSINWNQSNSDPGRFPGCAGYLGL